jgi:hypothetical protein
MDDDGEDVVAPNGTHEKGKLESIHNRAIWYVWPYFDSLTTGSLLS